MNLAEVRALQKGNEFYCNGVLHVCHIEVSESLASLPLFIFTKGIMLVSLKVCIDHI